MVEEPHTLSLLIRAPTVDDQTNKVSWPVLSWLYNTDLEISQEEAEEEFGFKMELGWNPHRISASVLSAMPEFNAEYGFNPTHKGTDICERYELPLLEIFNVSSPMEESMTSDAVADPFAPTSIISDSACQALHEEVSPLQGNDVDAAMETAEEVHVDEVLTEVEITTVLQQDRYSQLFVMICTAISTLVLSFIVQAYLQ
ncbi:hypothetical protein ARMSODRAFT_481285 [Armillaria solidipes]|uniref:Uncharacterized protein n=1 Tax=Armillaria solidipes TaxID=1076256 RepID=A0A2H3CH46_9AGAR|nr:hypothetical protein ARMSODRAFT_481285 [Armillaria solidipes]